MIETVLSLGAVAISAGIGAGVWYKMGKIETKIDFIYQNVNIVVDWKNGKMPRKESEKYIKNL